VNGRAGTGRTLNGISRKPPSGNQPAQPDLFTAARAGLATVRSLEWRFPASVGSAWSWNAAVEDWIWGPAVLTQCPQERQETDAGVGNHGSPIGGADSIGSSRRGTMEATADYVSRRARMVFSVTDIHARACGASLRPPPALSIGFRGGAILLPTPRAAILFRLRRLHARARGTGRHEAQLKIAVGGGWPQRSRLQRAPRLTVELTSCVRCGRRRATNLGLGLSVLL